MDNDEQRGTEPALELELAHVRSVEPAGELQAPAISFERMAEARLLKERNKLERKRRSDIPPEMRLRKYAIVQRPWDPKWPMSAEVARTASPDAETSTLEMSETEDSLYVSALVRQAISKRASESRYPLGWLDQERLDKVVAKFAHRRKRVPLLLGILIGFVLALIASVALLRAGSARRGSARERASASRTATISTAARI